MASIQHQRITYIPSPLTHFSDSLYREVTTRIQIHKTLCLAINKPILTYSNFLSRRLLLLTYLHCQHTYPAAAIALSGLLLKSRMCTVQPHSHSHLHTDTKDFHILPG